MTGDGLSPVDVFPDLFNNQDYQAALNEFFKTPLTQDERISITRAIFNAPKLWADFGSEGAETLAQTKKRREGLAKKLEELATELKRDQDGRHVRIISGTKTITTSLLRGSEPAYDFLNGLADYLREKEKTEDYQARLYFEATARNKRKRKEYCKREVVRILDSISEVDPFPNAAAATILNALLRPDLSNRITDDDVYQARSRKTKKSNF